MKKVVSILLVGAVLGGAGVWLVLGQRGSAHAEEEPPPGISIKAASADIAKQIAAIGLTTAVPESAQLAPELKAYGRVLDPSPLIAAVAEIETARIAATASAREHARIKALHDQGENASTQAVETAEAAMLRDNAQLVSIQARLQAAWGRGLTQQSGMGALIRDLAGGAAALLRLELSPGDAPSQVPAKARVARQTGEPAWTEVEVIGAAPSADPQSQGLAYLALWRGSPPAMGTALRATIASGAPTQRVLVIPRQAVVIYQGGSCVYVTTADGGFERRLVTLGPGVGAGVVVTDGVGAQDKVVITGAQQLLAIEILGGNPEPE